MNDHARPPRLAPADIDRLVDENLPALRAYVRARLGPGLAAHESASDVVQSVCRELVAEHRDLDYRGDAAFRGWLFSAALHKIWQHDRHRRAKKRAGPEPKPGTTSEGEARSLLDGYAHLVTPSREVSAREQVSTVEQALAALTDSDRELIALAKIANLPHAEIAARTGRSEEACRQALRRALVRLAAKLDELQGPRDRG
jgi:RNA polymerase sigma factor (sigma-70 family)